MRRRVVVLLVFACVVFGSQKAGAQLAPSTIEIRVVDAQGEPLGDARVFIDGPAPASALTPRDGRLRLSDVEPGLYGLRVEKRGFLGASVREVEALAGRRSIVTVTLERTALAQIGHVYARPSVAVTSTDVDEGGPLRRVSESLVDALGKLAGVTIDTSSANGTLTFSLNNADPSRTLTTIGGSPVFGGGAAQLQQVGADLATGAGVDTNAAFGGIGSVNFRTLEPTKTWQGVMSASYGTYEKTYATFSLSGSLRKLGIAVQHGVRGGDDVLTGLTFADTSGLAYPHDGAFARGSNFLKLRYTVSPKVTVTSSLLAGTNRSSPVCHDYVTTTPCGYGPGNVTNARSLFGDFRLQSQIGHVSFNAGANGSRFHFSQDDTHLSVAGIAQPVSAETDGTNLGGYASATLPLARHTLSLSAGTFIGASHSEGIGAFAHPVDSPFKRSYVQFGDFNKFSDRWDARASLGSISSVAGTTAATGLNVTLHPSRWETLALGASIGGAPSSFGSVANAPFQPPALARYNCRSGTVEVAGPGENAQPSSSRALDFTYDRRGRRGTLKVNVYDRLERNPDLQSQLPLGSFAGVPAGYVDALAATWSLPAICGTALFDSGRVFVSGSTSSAVVRYRGFDAQAQVVLGREATLQPSYAINGATLASANARMLGPGSPYALGAQIPSKPLHRAGLTIDVRQPRAKLEWLLNAQWTSANNPSKLSSYVVTNAGLTWESPRGNFTLVASNLFNGDSGLFSTTEFAAPISLAGGNSYLPVPTLVPPRSFSLIYTARTGRRH